VQPRRRRRDALKGGDEFLNSIKDRLPEHAKDIRLNLDSVIARSSLASEDACGGAGRRFAAGSRRSLRPSRRAVPPAEGYAALTAAALMGMNNVWYPFVEMADDEELKTVRPELRMNAYASHGGVAKAKFEAYALAASIGHGCPNAAMPCGALASSGPQHLRRRIHDRADAPDVTQLLRRPAFLLQQTACATGRRTGTCRRSMPPARRLELRLRDAAVARVGIHSQLGADRLQLFVIGHLDERIPDVVHPHSAPPR